MSSISVLLKLTRHTALYFTLCLLFSLTIFLALPLLLGLAAQHFFDTIANAHDPNALIVVGVIVAIQSAAAMSDSAFGAPWSPMQQKAQVLLRRNLFSAMLRDHGSHVPDQAVGDVVSRFRDDPALVADTLDALCDLIGRSLFVLAAGIVMWQVNPTITIVLAVPLAVCATVTRLAGHRIAAYRRAARIGSARVSAFLGDVLVGQLAIKVAGAGDNVTARLRELGDSRRKSQVRDTVFTALLEGFNLNVGNIGTIFVLLLAAHAMSRGTFTVGDLAMFVVFLGAVGWFPDEISRLIGGLKQIEVSTGRMAELSPNQPLSTLVRLQPPPPQHPENASAQRLERIQVRNLSYRHPATGKGIVDVGFTLSRGSVTVVTGPVGGGKSTLLRVFLGLLPKDAGETYWNGSLVLDSASLFTPPRAAYTPQVPRLFSESVRENVLQGVAPSSAELTAAIRSAVLEPDVDTMESGLDTLVGPRGIRLSGGQIQRVAAARMFVRCPELLVVDDLSSALDAHTEAELWDRFFDRSRDVTCLVVSHRPTLLRRADQVLLLREGTLTLG